MMNCLIAFLDLSRYDYLMASALFAVWQRWKSGHSLCATQADTRPKLRRNDGYAAREADTTCDVI